MLLEFAKSCIILPMIERETSEGPEEFNLIEVDGHEIRGLMLLRKQGQDIIIGDFGQILVEKINPEIVHLRLGHMFAPIEACVEREVKWERVYQFKGTRFYIQAEYENGRYYDNRVMIHLDFPRNMRIMRGELL